MASEWLMGPERPRTRFGELPLYREGLHRLSERAYAWLVPNGSWGETNIGLVVCGKQSVLIDTCWDLKFTNELLEATRSIVARAPIEYVINTHADGDHCWGNQLFPGRAIIASDACVRQMHHLKPRALQALGRGGLLLERLPFGELDKLGHYMHHMFAPYDFSNVAITTANHSFSGENALCVGGVDMLVSEVGPAHTDGDCFVYVPSEKLVYAGDVLFVGVTPVMWSGPIENMVSGLSRLKALDADTFVPGHGPLATRQHVQDVIDYWEFVHEALHTRFRAGMPAAAAARDTIFSSEFQRCAFAHWDSAERLVTSAYTMYRNWGAPANRLPGTLGVLEMFRHQAALAFALPELTPRVMRRF